MNWLRILAAPLLPALIAVPTAVVFWKRQQSALGTVLGAGVLLVGALIFGGLEYVDGIRFRLWCEQTRTPCRPSHPSDFIRISVYGFVAMAEIMALFLAAGSFESRLERKHYDRQWR